jgi:hypothetical protein
MKNTQKLMEHAGPEACAPIEIVETLGAALNPAMPRALLRLVNIAEMAGLITPEDQTLILDAFSRESPLSDSVAHVLDRFQCSVTELYVLVTLFAAVPRPVPLSALERETLSHPGLLRSGLDHLHEMAAILTDIRRDTEPAFELTPSGQSLAVFLMYRVIAAIV